MNRSTKSPEIQRLLHVLKVLQETPSGMAEKTGVSERTINNYIWGDMPIGGALLRGLVEAYAVSADWLLTGRGELFIDGHEALADDPYLIPYIELTDNKDAADRWLITARAAESALFNSGAVAGEDYSRLDLFKLVAPLIFNQVQAGKCVFNAKAQRG